MLGIWLLVGCSALPPATPIPTYQPIRIAYPPCLRPLKEILARCVSNYPEIALYPNEVSSESFSLDQVDLTFRLGATLEGAYAAQIGWEALVVIVHRTNSIERLSTDDLQAIYTGRKQRWENGESITVWSYPDGDETRPIWDAVVLASGHLPPETRLAPDPQAMLDVIAADPQAIGYVPQSWLSSVTQVRQLPIDEKLAEKLRQSVLSLSLAEPQGGARTLLLCLQQAYSEGQSESGR